MRQPTIGRIKPLLVISNRYRYLEHQFLTPQNLKVSSAKQQSVGQLTDGLQYDHCFLYLISTKIRILVFYDNDRSFSLLNN
jgi:hypothetical protein